MNEFLHFIKHLLGLCGESHPSVLITGGVFITTLDVNNRDDNVIINIMLAARVLFNPNGIILFFILIPYLS